MVMALAGCSKDGSMGMDHEGHSSEASGELSSDEIMFFTDDDSSPPTSH